MAADRLERRPAFEYRHVVSLEETNVTGNVYFANYLRWQGQCREMFLRAHAPEVFQAVDGRATIVTTRCSCEYFAELFAFDEVVLRMRAGELVQNRITLLFDYLRQQDGREELVARGEQQLAWMVRDGERFRPDRVPPSLVAAIETFISTATGAAPRG
ncbi:acyl-CoA thioesterase [Plantactinospora mayteni]|nr:acyl-CoA thioesterase [Plantactinospora mayteni]